MEQEAGILCTTPKSKSKKSPKTSSASKKLSQSPKACPARKPPQSPKASRKLLESPKTSPKQSKKKLPESPKSSPKLSKKKLPESPKTTPLPESPKTTPKLSPGKKSPHSPKVTPGKKLNQSPKTSPSTSRKLLKSPNVSPAEKGSSSAKGSPTTKGSPPKKSPQSPKATPSKKLPKSTNESPTKKSLQVAKTPPRKLSPSPKASTPKKSPKAKSSPNKTPLQVIKSSPNKTLARSRSSSPRSRSISPRGSSSSRGRSPKSRRRISPRSLRRSPRQETFKLTANIPIEKRAPKPGLARTTSPSKGGNATKEIVENGLPHDEEEICKGKDVELLKSNSEKAVDTVDHSSKDSTLLTPVRLRTCKSCSKESKVLENGDDGELHKSTEKLQCDKCHKEYSLDDEHDDNQKVTNVDEHDDSQKVPNESEEKCPMCEMVFESGELLDDHLLSPDSCKKGAGRLLLDDAMTVRDAAKGVPVASKADKVSTRPDAAEVVDKSSIPEDEAQTGVQNDAAVVDESSTCKNDDDEHVAEDNNNEDELSKVPDEEEENDLNTTLDGSVVDEMEDRDQELQQLAEEVRQIESQEYEDESQEIESHREVDESSPMDVDEISLIEVEDEKDLSNGDEDTTTKDEENDKEDDKICETDEVIEQIDEMDDAVENVEETLSSREDDEEIEKAKANGENVPLSLAKNGASVVDVEVVDDKVIVKQTLQHCASVVETKEGESAAEKSPEIMCNEIVEEEHPPEKEDIPVVPVAAIPATATMTLTNDESIESKDAKCGDKLLKLDDNVENEKPKVVQSDKKPSESKKQEVIEIIDSDSDQASVENKDPAEKVDAKVQEAKKETRKSDSKSDRVVSKSEAQVAPKSDTKTGSKPEAETESKPEAETESKPEAESESKPGVEKELEPEAKSESKLDTQTGTKPESGTKSDTVAGSKAEKPDTEAEPDHDKKSGDEDESESSSGIKKRFTTGNETLDQDIVDILQDATNSGVRVTRSMRNKKQQVSKTDDVKEIGKKPEIRTPISPRSQAISCKLVTSSNAVPGNKQGTVKNTNGSITLQVPVSSVHNGAKFIITIPENNSSQTPPGKYLITVPPTSPGSGEVPQVRLVLLKTSPVGSNSVPSPQKPANTPVSTDVTSTPVNSVASTTELSDESKSSELLEKVSEMESEAEQRLQLKKTIQVARLTKKVYIKELEEIDSVIFECPKCKSGFPHMLLVQLHMEDCCHHPPTQKPSLHMRIPTEILLKFFEKVPNPTRANFKCLTCQEILTFRRYRNGKYYPLLATHFATHTSPSVKVVNYTEHSQTKELADALTVHSMQAVDWVNHLVPPFTLANQPISHSYGTLEPYLCTYNKLHQESLLLLEYDSDELEEEMYLERRQKEKKKKRRGRHAKQDTGAYVCNWKSAITKEETNVVEVNEIGTPKSAFPDHVHRSGSLKHSILHSPSKAQAEAKKKKDSKQKSGGKGKKNKAKKDVSKQLFNDNKNRRRSPRNKGISPRRGRLLGSRGKGSDDDIILLSSDEESQHGTPSKELEKDAEKSKVASGTLSRQGSVDDDSSRSSFPSLNQTGKDNDDDRPPSRGSSIICLSDSNEDEREDSPKKKDSKVVKPANKTQQNTSTKSLMQKAVHNNAAKANNNAAKLKPSGVKDNVKEKVEEEVKKRKVPEAEVDDEEITVLSDVEEDEEDDGVDLNSQDYDPILLDKHQVKTYFQLSKDEPGIYECSLGGCSSCDCVAESDLFEHLKQHIHVEKVHPQKRAKTILFKGKVVPQYLKLTRHQIWAHFNNVTVNAEMEICDEYMQQYKQCRWGSCKQRVWTKYGRLSHHLRSHLRFTQVDNKRYHKMREMRKMTDANPSQNLQAVLQKIPPVKPKPIARPKILDGDEVVCLPEDVILSRYKYGKSPSKNVRGIFSCLSCSFSHHLDANASAVMTVKILACHLKQHLPLNLAGHSCLITSKAMKPSLPPDHYATKIRTHLPSFLGSLDSIKELPGAVVLSCYDMMKMKVVEPAVVGTVAPILNKDGVLYRCLHSGCHIGVVGNQTMALLKHIKEHKPDVGHKGTSLGPASEGTNRKRKTLPGSDTTNQSTIGTQSKQRKIADAPVKPSTSQQNQQDDSSDEDIIEIIEDSSQEESESQACSTTNSQPPESASQEDSQESLTVVSSSDGTSGVAPTDLPQWSTTNRGVSNAVTGIEPSRDNPSRSMNELRQSPNDMIVCSMPDVEAYFCEHIVKYSSIHLSDKVTFGKPSYSCPECGESGLKGVALKQHLENHIGKTIKWKSLMKNVPDIDSGIEQDLSPRKFRPVTKLKRLSTNRGIAPHRTKLNARKLDGKNGDRNDPKHKVMRGARQNFNSVLNRILTRERNIRWGKLSRSPIKRLPSFGGSRPFGKNMQTGSTPIRNLQHDLSLQDNRGQGHQSSSTNDAETAKQFTAVTDERQTPMAQPSIDNFKSKSNSSEVVEEVIDLEDEADIVSISSDEMETSPGQSSLGTSESQEEDLFLTIDDILKEHFTKEEKQRTRKAPNGTDINFVVVQYKCRRCTFATLTVLDVPEHVALHIKRKVILKIKMDK